MVVACFHCHQGCQFRNCYHWLWLRRFHSSHGNVVCCQGSHHHHCRSARLLQRSHWYVTTNPFGTARATEKLRSTFLLERVPFRALSVLSESFKEFACDSQMLLKCGTMWRTAGAASTSARERRLTASAHASAAGAASSAQAHGATATRRVAMAAR